MAKIPPLLPEETLARVLRLSKFDGLTVLVLGTIFALSAAAGGHLPFAAIGLLAAGAGAIELHGTALLRQGEPRGMHWLIASQPFLLLVVWSYCALRIWFVEIPPLPEHVQPLFAANAAQFKMPPDQFLHALNRIIYGVLATVALGFQGGLTIYYLNRRKPIQQALAVEDDE